MPKLGAKPDDRPYNTRCQRCGCIVIKAVSRFGFNGKPAAHAYQCANPYHSCGTEYREGCEPVRRYGEAVAHAVWDGAGGHWEHPGKVEECAAPECSDLHSHTAGLSPVGGRHLGRYVDCDLPECEPPFERGDVATAGDTSWGWTPPEGELPPWPGPLAGDEDE